MAASRHHPPVPPVTGFAPGTGIATDRGEVTVEELVVGDRILTMDHGYRQLVWSGPVQPHKGTSGVMIAADCLQHGLPRRKLVVGPSHRMLLAGPMVALHTGEHEAFAAADHIARPTAPDDGPLHHILLCEHEVILANGIWCESVLADDLWFNALPTGLRDRVPGLLESPHRQTARLCLAWHETAAILGRSVGRDGLAA